MKQFSWKKLLLLILAIPFVILATSYTAKTEAERVNELEQYQAPSTNNIKVVTSSQDAEGLTEEQLNLNFLKNLEGYILERVKVKQKSILLT